MQSITCSSTWLHVFFTRVTWHVRVCSVPRRPVYTSIKFAEFWTSWACCVVSSESEVSSLTLHAYAWSTVCPGHIWLVHCRTWHWTRTFCSAYVQVLLPQIPWIWKFPLPVGRFLFSLGHNFHVEKEDITRGTPDV